MKRKLPSINDIIKKGMLYSSRGSGICQLGDKVRWLGKEGTVIEIIPYGMYPQLQERLKVCGYYREYESYIVEDAKGQRYWPRVGSLTKMEKTNESINRTGKGL